MKQGNFCWNELMTPDVEKAKKFYSALFGWTYEEHKMQHGKYNVIKSESNDGGGLMQIPADMGGKVPPHWLSYVYVDNLQASVDKAVALGATLKMPVTTAGDFGHFAIITDPTGATLALWKPTQSNN